MTADGIDRHAGEVPRGRRSRQLAARSRRVEFSLTEDEFGDLATAAARARLARGAYAAEATLSAAREVSCPVDSPFREALSEFIRAAGLIRRIGVNLNQAVAKLNATGQRSDDLLAYAAESIRRARKLDDVAEEIHRKLQ
jgi:hypothetical protein